MANRVHDISLSLLRIATGLMFMPHGYSKLFGEQMPDLTSLFGIAGIMEFFGGGLIVLGLFTRPVAFLLSGQMAFAYWMSHAPRGFMPSENGGELAVLFCFIYLALSVHGGGSFSIDGLMKGRKS